MTSAAIFTRPGCTYCTMAKKLLQEAGIPYTEKVLSVDFTREFILEHFPGRTTYPVVLVDGMTVGGYDELKTYLGLTEDHNDPRKYLVE